jgi:signal transduction histidine kinase
MRCKEIVQQMLTYANPRPTGKAPLDARALNDEVLNFVFPPGRAGRFEVIREHDPRAPMIEADPNLIKQALLNLYLNARQAYPKDAQGRIVARIMGRRHGRLLRVEIEDDGQGIAEEDMERIFEPFFTRKEKGTGLGLAVTQRIIESFDGTISVETAKPHGALFILEFPAIVAENG